jgi:hypothetical protein
MVAGTDSWEKYNFVVAEKMHSPDGGGGILTNEKQDFAISSTLFSI